MTSTAWNVSLWIHNDEVLYKLACKCLAIGGSVKDAAKTMKQLLNESNITHTRDGYEYSVAAIKQAMETF